MHKLTHLLIVTTYYLLRISFKVMFCCWSVGAKSLKVEEPPNEKSLTVVAEAEAALVAAAVKTLTGLVPETFLFRSVSNCGL